MLVDKKMPVLIFIPLGFKTEYPTFLLQSLNFSLTKISNTENFKWTRLKESWTELYSQSFVSNSSK